MICPECGAANRDGASYCDTCGEPLIAGVRRREAAADDNGSDDDDGPREPLLGSGGLAGWMAFDWLMRFALVGVIGIVGGMATFGMGAYDFSAFFFILGIVGIVGTWYMIKAER